MIEQVPVIDIAELDSPESLRRIDRACREWGFFQVTGHGIEPALLRNIFEVSREFFAQPEEAKQRIRRDADNPWGYYDQELTKNRRDWKEIYDFGPADGDSLKPRWPGGYFRLRFEPVVRAYYANCRSLGLRLLAAMVQYPLLDAIELERERMVILDEISMYRDVPEDFVSLLSSEAMWAPSTSASVMMMTLW